MTDLFSRRRATTILLAAAVWTAGVWGSRIGLITGDELGDWPNIVRIVVSLAFAPVLAYLAFRVHRAGRSGASAVLAAFSGWMVIVWIPSLLSVSAGDSSAAFKLVHTVLAVVSLAFGASTAGQARREKSAARGSAAAAKPGVGANTDRADLGR